MYRNRREFLRLLGLGSAAFFAGLSDVDAPSAKERENSLVYRMGFFVAKGKSDPVLDSDLENADAIRLEFERRFNAATNGRVILETSPITIVEYEDFDKRILTERRFDAMATGTNAASLISEYMKQRNPHDEWDLVTMIDAMNVHEASHIGTSHLKIRHPYGTFRYDEKSDLSMYLAQRVLDYAEVPSKRINGITFFQSLPSLRPGLNNPQRDKDKNVVTLLHETGHEWVAYVDLKDPMGLVGLPEAIKYGDMTPMFVNKRDHYRENQFLECDIMRSTGGVQSLEWQQEGDRYKYGIPNDNGTHDKMWERALHHPYTNLTLYLMGALKRGEVGPLHIIKPDNPTLNDWYSFGVEPGSFGKSIPFSIDDINL